jgi:hypothetical protein
MAGPQSTDGKMKVIIRGFGDGAAVFEDHVEIEEATLSILVEQLVKKHTQALANHDLHMIEFEFPDDPPEERFFRIGSDPRGMVMPIRIK